MKLTELIALYRLEYSKLQALQTEVKEYKNLDRKSFSEVIRMNRVIQRQYHLVLDLRNKIYTINPNLSL